MDRIRTRDANGKQKSEYYKAYYLENKERLALKFKENYERIKADPLLLAEHQRQCAEATRRYRERHPDRKKPQQRKGYLNRRIKAFGILGGAFCVNCGCDVLEFLEVNHKNGGGCKEYRILGNSIFAKLFVLEARNLPPVNANKLLKAIIIFSCALRVFCVPEANWYNLDGSGETIRR